MAAFELKCTKMYVIKLVEMCLMIKERLLMFPLCNITVKHTDTSPTLVFSFSFMYMYIHVNMYMYMYDYTQERINVQMHVHVHVLYVHVHVCAEIEGLCIVV